MFWFDATQRTSDPDRAADVSDELKVYATDHGSLFAHLDTNLERLPTLVIHKNRRFAKIRAKHKGWIEG